MIEQRRSLARAISHRTGQCLLATCNSQAEYFFPDVADKLRVPETPELVLTLPPAQHPRQHVLFKRQTSRLALEMSEEQVAWAIGPKTLKPSTDCCLLLLKSATNGARGSLAL
ncbi:unnamed protein product [Symbiodinium natans]|uniref:Uncharacterized protein n=1 Tax=Symbiodinium natans TaxID=878477 RepID=A0A812RA63_9DINO|nr:unnamed protein product [Symbiodinium natans]